MYKKGEGQIQWTVTLVLISLFVIAILGFAINFASDNSSPISIVDDPMVSGLYTNATGDISSFNTNAEKTTQAIMNSSINTQSGTVESVGSFAITPGSLISSVTNIFRVGYYNIFGTSSGFGIFLTTFLALITFITGMYIWKTVVGRIPD